MEHFLCSCKKPSPIYNFYVSKNNPIAIIAASRNTHCSIFIVVVVVEMQEKGKGKKGGSKGKKGGKKEGKKK